MRKRYFKPVSLLELSKAWKLNDLLFIPNVHKGKQLFLRVTSVGTPHKQGGGSYVYEDEILPSDIILLRNKYFKLIE